MQTPRFNACRMICKYCMTRLTMRDPSIYRFVSATADKRYFDKFTLANTHLWAHKYREHALAMLLSAWTAQVE